MGLDILNDCKEVFHKVINLTNHYPEYKYTLNSQIIRAVISIGSNITEGNYRSKNQFNNYLDIAIGSCNEVLFQIELYNDKDIDNIIDKVNKIKATCIKIKESNETRESCLVNRES